MYTKIQKYHPAIWGHFDQNGMQINVIFQKGLSKIKIAGFYTKQLPVFAVEEIEQHFLSDFVI